eukprot:1124630-Heterocapsa_arctica.AAC.1
MPDTYLRESQLLALKLQEACLSHLRSGGMVEALDAARVGDVGLPAGTGWRLSTSCPRLWWKPVACPLLLQRQETSS